MNYAFKYKIVYISNKVRINILENVCVFLVTSFDIGYNCIKKNDSFISKLKERNKVSRLYYYLNILKINNNYTLYPFPPVIKHYYYYDDKYSPICFN